MSVWCIYLNLCNILNGMMKRSTDCSINLIFIRLASQLLYFELKNIYMTKYFIWILTNGFISQYMIKISSSGKIAPVPGLFCHHTLVFNSPNNKG